MIVSLLPRIREGFGRGRDLEKVNMAEKPPDRRYHRILRFEVEGGFLDGMRHELSESLNCVIGGRGTGKTTVLELIRWALNQMPEQSKSPALHRLVQANLGSGRVSIDVETLNGVRYRVQRGYGEEPIVLGENGEPLDIDIGSGNIFSAEIYSQNQIEEIANDPLFQLRLIDKFLGEKVHELGAQVDATLQELRMNATELGRLRKEVTGLKEQVTGLPEIAEKLKAFRSQDAGEEDEVLNAESQAKAVRDQEKKYLQDLQGALTGTRSDLEAVGAALPERIAEPSAEVLAGPNAKLLRQVKSMIDGAAREISQRVDEAIRVIDGAGEKLREKTESVVVTHLKQEKAYQDLLGRFEKEKDRAKERDKLRRRHNELQDEKKKLDRKSEELQKKEAARKALLLGLSELRDERYQLRADVAKTISKQLTPTIRVRIEQYGNNEAYRDFLMESMKGAGFKYAQIVDRVVQRVPPNEFAAIVQRADVETLMDHLELDQDRANRFMLQLKDSRVIFDVELVELHDRPTIELRDGASYKDSSSLSTGQKCTTILPILLLESASPLLIDQPEDNLDNAYIYETVVRSVRGVQGRRQLIFVTHNPNLPVLSGEGRVFVLASTGEKASVKAAGTVDEVKDEVETILEGGKEAFQQRKARYGY